MSPDETVWLGCILLASSALARVSRRCRSTDLRLQGVVLRRQLQALSELLPPGQQESFAESAEGLTAGDDPNTAAQEVQVALSDGLPAHQLPEGFVPMATTCLQQFVQNRERGAAQLARSGVFWVNMGLLQLQVWSPQTIFDPAVKRAYKLTYAQEEVGRVLTASVT